MSVDVSCPLILSQAKAVLTTAIHIIPRLSPIAQAPTGHNGQRKGKANKGKGKAKKDKVNKKASFRRTNPKRMMKSKEKLPEGLDLVSMAPMSPYVNHSTYGDYDLKPLPLEAWPNMNRSNRGKHSYTLADGQGAVVEVLLSKKCFYIKKVKPGFPGPDGQLSWNKLGGATQAWNAAKERSGYSS